MTENTPTLPFAGTALRYVESGSGSPLPIPAQQKLPHPAGFTGRNRSRPTVEQVDLWCELEPASNVAVRLANGALGEYREGAL